jgi:hypothetical protein
VLEVKQEADRRMEARDPTKLSRTISFTPNARPEPAIQTIESDLLRAGVGDDDAIGKLQGSRDLIAFLGLGDGLSPDDQSGFRRDAPRVSIQPLASVVGDNTHIGAISNIRDAV